MEELRKRGLGDCMLSDDSNFKPLQEVYPAGMQVGRVKTKAGKVLCGNYIHWDPYALLGGPVRSGMSVDIKSRVDVEYKTNANNMNALEIFYRTYPGRGVAYHDRNTSCHNGVCHEDLKTTLGLGLILPVGPGKRVSNSRNKIIEAVAAGFEFPDEVLQRMKKSKHKRFKDDMSEYKGVFHVLLVRADS